MPCMEYALITLAALLMLAGCENRDAKQYVIGLVNPNQGTLTMLEGFMNGLSEQGFVEGRNITYIRATSVEGLAEAIESMTAKPVDLIFTATTPAAKLAQKATAKSGIPVVFALYDPVESGLVQSLPHPGGNMTGIQIRGSTQKALEWLMAVTPEARHIFVPVSLDTRAASQSLADLENAAAKLGVRLSVAEVGSPDELDHALSTMPGDAGAVFLLHSILISSNADRIVSATAGRGIPIGSCLGLHESSITVTFAPNHFQMGRQASRLAARVLAGIPPRDIPVEVANFYLGVNLKAATESGVHIPSAVLDQADYIIR